MQGILLMGAGALARDLVDLFGQQAFAGAYVDPAYFTGESVGGVRVYSDWQQAVGAASHFLLAVSSIELRERARLQAVQAGLVPAPAMISTLARVSATARLGEGSVVADFTVVGPGAGLGAHGLLMHGVVLGHDSTVLDNVVVCAGVSIGGYVRIGARSFIGTNAVLAPQVQLGSECFVGAGAACLRSAPDQSLLIGNPARRTPHLPPAS